VDSLYFLANILWPYIMAILILMIILRTSFSVFSIITSPSVPSLDLLRSFLPGCKFFPSRPLFVVHRIIFHICLFICFFFLNLHIDAWGNTLPQWILYFLPSDALSNKLTECAALFVIFSVIYMFLKRWILKDLRQNSRLFDFTLPFVILIPFVTGYFNMTGQETSIQFLDNNFDTIHILSGEICILTGCFLFCRTVIIKKRCVACLACVNNCPSGALETEDVKEMRHIHYAAGNCIHCGTCVAVCEECASELRHILGLPWPGRKQELCAIEMFACKTCNTLFATQRQLYKLQQKNIDYDLAICPECRQLSHAKSQQKLLSQTNRRLVRNHD